MKVLLSTVVLCLLVLCAGGGKGVPLTQKGISAFFKPARV
jgi:hypothetical protein